VAVDYLALPQRTFSPQNYSLPVRPVPVHENPSDIFGTQATVEIGWWMGKEKGGVSCSFVPVH
jgi:hypothetical protein